VGEAYLDVFFRRCCELLAPDGMMALQVILMPDREYERYRRSVDFIQRYVFPGSFLPSLGAIQSSLGRVTDFRVENVEDIRPHYARTLRAWRERFRKNLDEVRRQGYPESFIRLWDYYFCYCEAGFEERYVGDAQILLARPDCRVESYLP
jgi:cyclopropane-fatty-acyl-phospholipid synthase